MGLLMLFVHYFAWLSERMDGRARQVKLVLLTATKEGAAVAGMERRCIDAGLATGEITVQRPPGSVSYTVYDLWGDCVERNPVSWKRASMPERACMAAEAT